jgi:hypothetical protein
MSEKTTRAKKAPVVEEKKKVVCKDHHQLHMCFSCNDEHCKEQGFYKMHRCKNNFNWILALWGTVITIVLMVAVYIIARLIDGAWSDWSLPVGLLTGGAAVILTAFIICKIIDAKHKTGDAIYEN